MSNCALGNILGEYPDIDKKIGLAISKGEIRADFKSEELTDHQIRRLITSGFSISYFGMFGMFAIQWG